jgi:carboxyl-terminal processing protease
LVILVNEGTASASEILAGALHYYRLGTMIGTKTFGKGIEQTEIQLNQGTAMHVTIAQWLLPDGTSINQKGLTPDSAVDLSNDDYKNGKDPQLDKALEILGTK